MNETEKLYQQYAYDSPAVDDWIDQHGNIDTVRAFGPIAEMKGRFVPAKVSHIYQHQFVPDSTGTQRAIVMPVIEDGATVDIVAWRLSQAKLDVWGCVTHAARFLNRAAIYDKSRTAPLGICESWWHWLRTGCKGVMALRVEAIPELRNAGDVLVDNSSIALRLLYEAYLWPLNVDPDSDVWKAAKIEGKKRIWIDDDRAAA
ncbi:hypothetical protein V1292_004850 [Bradyrhizobium sp. AZCC 1719]|uniref:hypothetical protein n=1 Tax=Bradyrhizobium sp. AZCC 1719 TaxID=3117028 RepID=UPI002FEE801C